MSVTRTPLRNTDSEEIQRINSKLQEDFIGFNASNLQESHTEATPSDNLQSNAQTPSDSIQSTAQTPRSDNMNANGDNAATAAEITAVQNCKLPRCEEKEHIEMWLTQIESIFASSRITSENTKYHLTIAALPTSMLYQVSEVVKKPPETNKYTTLKNKLLACFTDSTDKRVQKVLNELELGDRKPSELLRHMRQQLDGKLDDDVLRVKWLSCLPTSAQRILKVFKANSLDELAAAANEILDTTPTNGVFAVKTNMEVNATSVNNYDAVATELSALRASFAQLAATNKTICDLLQAQANNTNYNQRSNHRFRSPSPRRNNRYCRYHYKFGEMANKCEQPCAYKPQQRQDQKN